MQMAGVTKVIVAQNECYDHNLPEVYSPLIVAAQKAGSFTHVVAAHSAFGKNVLPRVAAVLDVAQVSDVLAVESPDTFVRSIYAGMCFPLANLPEVENLRFFGSRRR